MTDKEEEDQIYFLPFLDGAKKPVSLVRHYPPAGDDDWTNSPLVDVVVPAFLKRCGMSLRFRGVATAPMVAMFLVRQTGETNILANLWDRIVNKDVSDSVKTNEFWKSTESKVQRPVICAGFWCNLLRKDLECRLNPAFLDISPVLAALAKVARDLGVCDVESRILAFSLLCHLPDHSLEELLRIRKFQKFLFGRAITENAAANVANAMSKVQLATMEGYEDARVMLLASAFFRNIPIVEESGRSGNFPVTAKTVRDGKRRADAERIRKKREEAQKDLVGHVIPDLIPVGPGFCPAGDMPKLVTVTDEVVVAKFTAPASGEVVLPVLVAITS